MAINFLEDISINGELTTTGATNNITTTNGSSSLYLLNLTRTTTSLTTAGSVGIGTTNPAYKLSVENSLSVFSSGDTADPKIEGHLLRVTDTANDNPDIEHRYVENHSLNYGFSWFMDGGNNNFSLRRHENSANGTTVFRVNRSNDTAYFAGNVGIGTTSPSTKLDVNGTFEATSVRSTGGNDGGFVLRQWTHSSGYASLATNGMTGLEYCVISDGTNTFIGAGSSGRLTLRGPANDSSPQIAIDGSSITVDNGPSNVGQGSIRAKYKSSDNSAGITTTVGVKNASQSQNLTLTIKDGVITGVSSDRRLKTNITLIGTSDSGINIYTFEYKYKFSIEGVGLFQGVMSDEVPEHAVSVDHHGFDIVDYSVIDVEFKRVSI